VALPRGAREAAKNAELGVFRLLLVMSSLSPVFLLWAVRGGTSLSDLRWLAICAVLLFAPNLIVWFVINRAIKRKNEQTIVVKSYADRREHLITYLFALLIPIYDANIGHGRELAAAFLALAFIAFLFWYMRLHYINVVFAIFGYRLYEVEVQNVATATGGVTLSYERCAVISKRATLPIGAPLVLVRLGGTVFLDSN